MTEAHETQKQKTGVGTVQRPGLKAKAAERPWGRVCTVAERSLGL